MHRSRVHRSRVRRSRPHLPRRALEDRATFAAEYDATREQIAKLDAAAQSARRDVAVHEEAIAAYDPRGLRTGLIVLAFLAVLALAGIVIPVVWRATRVVEPPIVPVETAPSR